MKKNFTALAIAVAGMTAQDAFAVSASAITNGTQVQIGCTAPSALGATVYSIDASAIDPATNPTVANAVALPSSVTAGASCTAAISAMVQASIGTGGKWVAPGSVAVTTTTVGVSPLNITIPGSGYSLQAYTFVAQ